MACEKHVAFTCQGNGLRTVRTCPFESKARYDELHYAEYIRGVGRMHAWLVVQRAERKSVGGIYSACEQDHTTSLKDNAQGHRRPTARRHPIRTRSRSALAAAARHAQQSSSTRSTSFSTCSPKFCGGGQPGARRRRGARKRGCRRERLSACGEGVRARGDGRAGGQRTGHGTRAALSIAHRARWRTGSRCVGK